MKPSSNPAGAAVLALAGLVGAPHSHAHIPSKGVAHPARAAPVEPAAAPLLTFDVADQIDDLFQSELPDLGDGNVVTRRGGVQVRWRPLGLFVSHRDGSRTLVARPTAVPSVESDGIRDYNGVYPGVSERHRSGHDYFKREIVLGDGAGGIALGEGESLLVAWLLDLRNVGFLLRVPERGGGLMLFDDDQEPAMWMMAPFVLASAVPDPGLPPAITRYHLDVVEGQMEIAVEMDVGRLLGDGDGLPIVVDVTTVDLR